ncbi:MAG: DUF3099 domain-containing protein [Actinobacteria bacterium]|nr:DUF3099 domain-containing protein [Actinomycetota bacterium]
MAKKTPTNYVITSVQRGISEEQRGRRDRYMIGMSIRTICFVGAIVATGTLRWILLAGAIFLPYIAVFIANAGREWDKTPFTLTGYRRSREITNTDPKL